MNNYCISRQEIVGILQKMSDENWKYEWSNGNQWSEYRYEVLNDLIKFFENYTNQPLENSIYDLPDNDLPGMWESSDFTEGKPERCSYHESAYCVLDEGHTIPHRFGTPILAKREF